MEVNHSKNFHPRFRGQEIHTVREASNQSSPDVGLHDWKLLRGLGNPPEELIDTVEECQAQAVSAGVLPSGRGRDIVTRSREDK